MAENAVSRNESIVEEVLTMALPFEAWEKLPGESSAAYAAFCAFRDFGPERSIKRAVEASEPCECKRQKRYNVWRGWSTRFQWAKRASDYDVYLDKLKHAQRRKTIEAREAAYREVTGKMLGVVSKRLDLMDARELTQGNVKEWMTAAISTEREVFGIANTGAEEKDARQPELAFVLDWGPGGPGTGRQDTRSRVQHDLLQRGKPDFLRGGDDGV